LHCQARLCGRENILLTDVKQFESLAAIGLDLWCPRGSIIVPEPLIINACCAVVVFNPQPLADAVLAGMLSVLQLQARELMLVKIHSANPDLALVAYSLKQWQPQTILQLSMDMTIVLDNIPIVRTFSPEFLMANVQHKPQAYKDLLTLRKILDHGTSRRIA